MFILFFKSLIVYFSMKIFFFSKKKTQLPPVFTICLSFLLLFVSTFVFIFMLKQDNLAPRNNVYFTNIFASKKYLFSIIVKFSCFAKSKPYMRACVGGLTGIFGNESRRIAGDGCAWDQHANDVYHPGILLCISGMTRTRVWPEYQKRSCVPDPLSLLNIQKRQFPLRPS